MFDKEIGFKEIIFTSNSDSVIGEVNADMYAINGLSDVIHGDTDNNVMETKEINDSLGKAPKKKSNLIEIFQLGSRPTHPPSKLGERRRKNHQKFVLQILNV